MEKPRYTEGQILAGTIREWLVVGPFPLPDVAPEELLAVTDQAVVNRQLENEAGLEPRAGEQVLVDGKGYAWTETRSQIELTNFADPLQTSADRGTAYAVAYVISERDRPGLRMRVGGGMKSRIWVNGDLCYSTIAQNFYAFHGSLAPSVDLRQGVNRIVFKTVNDSAFAWCGSIRFMDVQGNIVPIRTTLVPSEAGVNP